jgi:tripartite-type tricarboxylate transporter receptor subunit TctC
MNSYRGALGAIVLACGCVAAFMPLAAAQSVEDFYRGKRIRLIVGSAAGGAYDAFVRTMNPYMTRFIPGNPTFVVENMPGGGGLLSANYLYNIAPKDGLVIGMVERGSAMEPIVNAKAGLAKFDSRKFNWIGSPTQETGLNLIGLPSQVETVDDLKKYEVIVSSTTHTAPTSVYPRMLNGLFGTKFKVIEGYKSSRDAILAVYRGEVQGHVSGASSGVLRSQIAPWIEEGKMKVLMQLGLKKDPAYPSARLVTELATTEAEQNLLSLMLAQQVMAYPLVAPPNVPPERVKAFRAAFNATVTDAGFLADTAKQNLQVIPASGEEIDQLLVKLYATPPEILDRYAELSAK